MAQVTATAELEEALKLSESSVHPVSDITLNQLIYVLIRLADQIQKDPPPAYDYRWSTLVTMIRTQLPKSLYIKDYSSHK